MQFSLKPAIAGIVVATLVAGCGGGSAGPASNVDVLPVAATGSISISLTDGPWEEVRALVLHITGVELGRSNGDVVRLDLPGGPLSVDMMELQNGLAESLISNASLPAGQYEWIRLRIDLEQSYIDMAGTGGRHGMQMGANSRSGLEVPTAMQILESTSAGFMLDFDVRRGVRHLDLGMMGDQFELYSAMRLVNMDEAGGLTGKIDPAMIDVNHPDCDDSAGGNRAYLFPGDATEPDDIADAEADGRSGPIATDRVEMDTSTGEFIYHFAYLPPGDYRIAFTCSGEWDEEGDDDHPADDNGKFDFQLFSGPLEVKSGQLHKYDLML